MTDPRVRLALEAPSDRAALRILEGGSDAGTGLSAVSGREPLTRQPGNPAAASRFEISPRERQDELERDRHDDQVDPWGYDETPEPDVVVRIDDAG